MSYPLFVVGKPPIFPLAAIEIDNPQEATGDYYLHWRDEQYFLTDRLARHQPLTIDFMGKNYQGRTGIEFLPKTLRGLQEKKIADATAGWGKDAWLLASRGFSLTLYERNPYLFTLLQHALERARHNPRCTTIVENITLHHADARTALPKNHFSAIYLDPMYPARRKKAQVKKQMQALQQLLGGEEKGEDTLLQKALDCAEKRVIVKRPQGAPHLAEKKPSYTIDAPNTRYDVYVL